MSVPAGGYKCFRLGLWSKMGRNMTVPLMAGGERCGFVVGWLVPAPVPPYPDCS